MNIGFYKKPKAHSLLTALYFAGIVTSLCALYLLPGHLSESTLRETNTIVGLTFFLGICSIYLTARSIRHSVVYLEKKQENAYAKNEEGTGTRSSVIPSVIDEIIQSKTDVPQKAINAICGQLQAGQGAIYVAKDHVLMLEFGYALSYQNDSKVAYAWGEGLIGRVAAEGKTLYIDQLPKDYITIFSGLGSASPSHLVIVPLIDGGGVKGVMEIATFSPVNDHTLRALESVGEALANAI